MTVGHSQEEPPVREKKESNPKAHTTCLPVSGLLSIMVVQIFLPSLLNFFFLLIMIIVLGKAHYPRVEASQGFYCSGFIQPTNIQTNDQKRWPKEIQRGPRSACSRLAKKQPKILLKMNAQANTVQIHVFFGLE